jgi:hypothetical protein
MPICVCYYCGATYYDPDDRAYCSALCETKAKNEKDDDKE